MSDEIHYATELSLKDIFSWGDLGMVFLDQENENAIMIERGVYVRISEHGGHRRLLHYHGPYESGIRPEFIRNNTLRSLLGNLRKISTPGIYGFVGPDKLQTHLASSIQ
jgi:hypothetical protein